MQHSVTIHHHQPLHRPIDLPQLNVLAQLLTLAVQQICSKMEPNETNRTVFPFLYNLYECKREELYVLQRRDRYDIHLPDFPITVWKIVAPAMPALGAGFRNGSQWYLRSNLAATNVLSSYTTCYLPAPGYALRLDSLSSEARPRTTSGMGDFLVNGCSTAVQLGAHSLVLTQRNGSRWLQDRPTPPEQVEYDATHIWFDEEHSFHSLELEIVFQLRPPHRAVQPQFTVTSRGSASQVYPYQHYPQAEGLGHPLATQPQPQNQNF